MAMTLWERTSAGNLVGAAVYKNYTPVSCGKIVEDLGPTPLGNGQFSTFHTVKVKWLKDGSVTEISTHKLACYESLVADHRRKLQNQSATLERINAL